MPSQNWTREMEIQACREGWSLFDTGETLKIERIDTPSDHEWWIEGMSEEPAFEGDDKALEFVIHHAKLGSALHVTALEMHCLGYDPSLGKPVRLNSVWDEIDEQRAYDDDLADSAVELRDTLEELMGELDKIADVEANKAVKPEQEDSFWLAGNIPATLVGRVRELISKLK